MADILWRGLNPYNYYPLLSKDVPKHARCNKCPACSKLYFSGLQGSSWSRERGITCLECSR